MIAIVGPTASGKTETGLALARQQNSEVISVDSRQVYKGLPIGTAQPPKTDVPYHLIGFLDPKDVFSAADFVDHAERLISEIQERGKTPILVGGTGFYFRALFEGLANLPKADEAIRQRLRAEAEAQGRTALHERLRQIDPKAAEKIPANNIQRLIRALEVYELTGKPISTWHEEHKKTSDAMRNAWNVKIIGLDPGKEILGQRIAERSEKMLQQGMIEETKALLDQGYPDNCPGLSGLGYPHVVSFLKGKMSKTDLLAQLILETRQYAKRQRTWFRGQMEVEWKKS